MVSYEELYNEAKQTLSPERFKHSEGVVKRAIEYAKIYNVDIETVKLVAIAHDIAKELTEQEKKDYISYYKIEFDEIEKLNPKLHHAKIGAYICRDKYGFTEDMVNAVKYHTTGRPNMSILEKIIYLADLTEENRTIIDLDYYVGIIKENIDKGMAETFKFLIPFILKNNSVIHLDSIKCYNYYKKIVGD